ncbi:MAG: DnaJ domain-containing protein [Kordiimonadaceae bacterium]|nr:DnaJ domain-containing protein [Kordiimonadaceae bacterium]
MAGFLLGGILLAGALLVLLNWWSKAEVASAKTGLVWGIIGVCVLLGVLLLASGRGFAAIAPIGYAGWRMLGFGQTLASLYKRFGGGDKAAGGPKPPATLSRDDALEVLGLQSGASDQEIKEAHKRLIAQCHPDKGGSDWMAARVNDARRALLNK